MNCQVSSKVKKLRQVLRSGYWGLLFPWGVFGFKVLTSFL